MDFMIRAGGELDLDDVYGLERSVADAPHWSREAYAALIGPDSAGAVRRCLLVAEVVGDEGVVRFVGFAVGKVIGMGGDSTGELESVVVAEHARRRGVGRSLCGAVLVWCREQGANAVELEVRSENTSARMLYRRIGFAEGGLRKGYYRDPPDDAVLMRIELGGNRQGQQQA